MRAYSSIVDRARPRHLSIDRNHQPPARRRHRESAARPTSSALSTAIRRTALFAVEPGADLAPDALEPFAVGRQRVGTGRHAVHRAACPAAGCRTSARRTGRHAVHRYRTPARAVPLGDHVLDAAWSHRHPGMERLGVGHAVGDRRCSRSAACRDAAGCGNAQLEERGRPAFLDRVEVGHRGERALPEAGLALPVRGARGEPVGVRLELLALLVALPLDRLAVVRVDVEQAGRSGRWSLRMNGSRGSTSPE